MLQSEIWFLFQLIDPDYLLFFEWGIVLTLLMFLSKITTKWLLCFLVILEGTILWKILLNLWVTKLHIVPEKLEIFSYIFLSHRWLLLLPLPFLIALAIVILSVYQNKINETVAKEYKKVIFFVLLTSFVFFTLSVIESVF